jgi:hypothetical protein
VHVVNVTNSTYCCTWFQVLTLVLDLLLVVLQVEPCMVPCCERCAGPRYSGAQCLCR